MNDENLKKGKATRFTTNNAKENGSKGGKAAAETKRRKADIKKVLLAMMNDTYVKNGEKLTGAELLAATLFAIATKENHKQCIQAQRLIYELTGQDKTTEDRKRIKQALKLQEKELELMQKKIDADGDWE